MRAFAYVCTLSFWRINVMGGNAASDVNMTMVRCDKVCFKRVIYLQFGNAPLKPGRPGWPPGRRPKRPRRSRWQRRWRLEWPPPRRPKRASTPTWRPDRRPQRRVGTGSEEGRREEALRCREAGGKKCNDLHSPQIKPHNRYKLSQVNHLQ